jgi:hypothetical protein
MLINELAFVGVFWLGYANTRMELFQVQLFSGVGWIIAASMAVARLFYQVTLTAETYHEVFSATSVLPFHLVNLCFFTWLFTHWCFRIQKKASTFGFSWDDKSTWDFIYVLGAIIANLLSHLCASGCSDWDMDWVTQRYASDSFIRFIGGFAAIMMCAPHKFCAGWVMSQLRSPNSTLSESLPWRAEMPAKYVDWAVSYYMTAWPNMQSAFAIIGTTCAMISSIMICPVSDKENQLAVVLFSIIGNQAALHCIVHDLKYFNIEAHKELMITKMEYVKSSTMNDYANTFLPETLALLLARFFPRTMGQVVDCTDFKVDSSAANKSKVMHLISAGCAAFSYTFYVVGSHMCAPVDDLYYCRAGFVLLILSSITGFVLSQSWVFEWSLFNGVALYWYISVAEISTLGFFIVCYVIILTSAYVLGGWIGDERESKVSSHHVHLAAIVSSMLVSWLADPKDEWKMV